MGDDFPVRCLVAHHPCQSKHAPGAVTLKLNIPREQRHVRRKLRHRESILKDGFAVGGH